MVFNNKFYKNKNKKTIWALLLDKGGCEINEQGFQIGKLDVCQTIHLNIYIYYYFLILKWNFGKNGKVILKSPVCENNN